VNRIILKRIIQNSVLVNTDLRPMCTAKVHLPDGIALRRSCDGKDDIAGGILPLPGGTMRKITYHIICQMEHLFNP